MIANLLCLIGFHAGFPAVVRRRADGGVEIEVRCLNCHRRLPS